MRISPMGGGVVRGIYFYSRPPRVRDRGGLTRFWLFFGIIAENVA